MQAICLGISWINKSEFKSCSAVNQSAKGWTVGSIFDEGYTGVVFTHEFPECMTKCFDIAPLAELIEQKILFALLLPSLDDGTASTSAMAGIDA